MQGNGRIGQKSPLIVELVGPAGAGKTTLAGVLSKRDDNIVLGPEIEMRKAAQIPILFGNAPSLLPVILRARQQSRGLRWDEIKAMVYLKAWPRVLEQQATRSGATVLLDHGPVFKLATLHAFGPDRFRGKAFEKWWNEMFRQWSNVLDMIIWLDAPDALLVERINTRNRRHAVRGKPELEATRFLKRYRTSFVHILAMLSSNGGPTLLQFETNQASIDEIVDDVLAACTLERTERTVAPVETADRAGLAR